MRCRVFAKLVDEVVGDLGAAYCVAECFGDVGFSGESVDADGEVADAGHDVCGVAGADLGGLRRR